jgi:hypothetical protein
MFLFKRKANETEEPTPTPSLANVTLEDLENFDEATFKQTVQTTPTDELRARLDALSKYLHKLPVKPLEKVEERQQRRAKLHRLMSIISIEVRQRDEEGKRKAIAEAQKWVQETVPKVLCDLRFNYNDAASLKAGLLTLGAVRWEKPKNNVITAKLSNGFSMDFDLLTIPSPLLRTILANPFNPVYISLTQGALRNGKPYNQKFQSKDFIEQSKIKPVADSYLALMRV